MKLSLMSAVVAAGLMGFGAFAQEAKKPAQTSETKPELKEEADDEFSWVSAEFSLSFDSKYMTYGVIDGKDPILTPGAKLTLADWVYFGIEEIFDINKSNGKWGGYGNRAWRYTTLDAIGGVAHAFDIGETLGSLELDVNYIYEYIQRYHGSMDDTQYVNASVGLPDLWLEPCLSYERDIMADEGTYLNFEVGHTFPLVKDGEDNVLTFRPAIGQGFGDKHRTRGYDLASDHGGVMDTCIKGEFEWAICEHLSLSAYVAYYDYWFDSTLREGARDYNDAAGDTHDSYNFVGGLAITAGF